MSEGTRTTARHTEPLLVVRDLRTVIDDGSEAGIRAVDGVSFDVSPGRTLGIVGESGSGKSMTALTVLGLLPEPAARIASGQVQFAGRDVARLSRRGLENLRGRDIGMVFQDPMTSLNPTMRVGKQVAEPLRRHLGLERGVALARARELLDEVQLPQAAERMRAYPHELSGGMRQRVMIAIAIACRPRLLIADEPTTALDVTTQAEILDLLERLRVEHEMGMIMITHDMSVMAQMAHDVLVMYAGQVVEQAPSAELFARPQHPYTEALLGALPSMDRQDARTTRLTAIPGTPPELSSPPEGCRFAARCRYADLPDDCAGAAPALRRIGPRHWVRTAHPTCERTATVGSAS